MNTPEPSPQPPHIQPALPMRWLGALCRVHLIGAAHLPHDGTILAVRNSHLALFRAIYSQILTQRQGFLVLPDESDPQWQSAVGLLQSGRDALLAVGASSEGEPPLLAGLRLARIAERPILPVGIGAAPVIGPRRTGGQVHPLPGARVVVVLEAPFQVPQQPAEIPTTWGATILHLLQQAEGRAQDILATWRRQGKAPTP